MELFRRASEELARKTSRRGLFSRSAGILTGALLGIGAGQIMRPGSAEAHWPGHTVCSFPGPPCACEHCHASGLCAKPCVIVTQWYSSGCWVTSGVTCCDCDCDGTPGYPYCGCGSDWHNRTDPDHCPNGNAG